MSLPDTLPQKVHFIGVGGAGMSGIALVLHAMGCQVTGSDLKRSRYTRMLSEKGLEVRIGHHEGNVDGTQAVVVSSAIPPGNVELREALKLGLPVYQRAQMLSVILEKNRGIAVAGAHGKTTTTSMIAHVLSKLGLDPTYVIGGELNDIGSNARYGKGPWGVVEADESDGSLLYLTPGVAVITNIELDHHSHYRSTRELLEVFAKFVAGLPPDGLLVCGLEESLQLAPFCRAPIHTFSLEAQAHFRACDVVLERKGVTYTLLTQDKKQVKVTLPVPGRHNILNSLATLATLDFCGIAPEQAAQKLGDFQGAARRFQKRGTKNEVTVVDDYAHHPTEVACTLEAAKSGDWGRVIAIFQPHLYSRTRHLHEEFGKALWPADIVIICDIYGAREQPEPGISGKLIVESLLKLGHHSHAYYVPKPKDIPLLLNSLVRPGDLVLTLGAGDIVGVGEAFLTLPDTLKTPALPRLS